MPLYEFECTNCSTRIERVIPLSAYEEPPCPECGGKTEQKFETGHGGSFFRMTPGKETGIYDFDYGKKATWDLTVPGKMERLKREGVIGDPFEK